MIYFYFFFLKNACKLFLEIEPTFQLKICSFFCQVVALQKCLYNFYSMKNFLKYTVITLGLLIVILFTIMVIAITHKYNKNSTPNQNIDLNPKIKFEENIKDYFIEGSSYIF